MNKIKAFIKDTKMGLTLGALALVYAIAHPVGTFAQMSTTTADSAVDGVISDVSASMATNIVKILVVLAGLVALGWGIRKFLKWVGGKKF